MSVTDYDFNNVVNVQVSKFQGKNTAEYHFFIRPFKYATLIEQIKQLKLAYTDALKKSKIPEDSVVFRRVFCSDLTNQAALLKDFDIYQGADFPCAVSRISQPPATPSKICMWAYHIADTKCPLKKHIENGMLSLNRGNLTHHWATNLVALAGESSYKQTKGIFDSYISMLSQNNLKLADNCIRLWLFVQNVDVNYKGLVDARREIFTEQGLTKDTHYIASTGIEGRCAEPKFNVSMDAYAIEGLCDGQVQYISAPEHLSPTYIYGVTFERATSISYSDRKHIYVSGTASIDKEGKVLYEADVLRQIDRTIENLEALLSNADAKLTDIASAIVYVRDTADIEIIRKYCRKYLKDTPFEVILAPVCRPQWLAEIEAIAIVGQQNANLPHF
jgi:enamine deaminase RidA (YjgF/YER057c/UK114 family)